MCSTPYALRACRYFVSYTSAVDTLYLIRRQSILCILYVGSRYFVSYTSAVDTLYLIRRQSALRALYVGTP